MGVDIYPFVECDFQNTNEPFSDSSSVRAMNSGHFFVWRSLELFYALGLDYWQLDLPPSPLVLGKIPPSLSWTIIRQHAVILSKSISKNDNTGDVTKIPETAIESWRSESLQYLPVEKPEEYHLELEEQETLILDPGCLLPNHALSSEIRLAIDQCGFHDEKIDYFLAIVDMMDKLTESLSPEHVRLVYWFDFLDPSYMQAYREKHAIPCSWPT